MATETELDDAVSKMGLSLKLGAHSQVRAFANYRDLKSFIQAEASFWRGVGTEFQPFLVEAVRELEALSAVDLGYASNKIVQLHERFRTTPIVYSDNTDAQFLKLLYATGAETGKGAYEYFTNRSGSQLGRSQEYFDGALRASLLRKPGVFDKQAASHIAAFEMLRLDVETTRGNLQSEVQTFKKDLTIWRSNLQAELTKFIEDQTRCMAELHTTQKGTLEDLFKTGNSKIVELENLYREKLRLEGPAKYWEELEDRYLKSGRWWIFWACLTVLVATVAGGWVLYDPPSSWLNDKLTTTGTIKSTIVATVSISLVFYLTLLFVRLATSSYHLARDARERYQLTHVYLALLSEKAVEPKEREIIFSSLFCRADTGLLKHDGSPTLPGSIGSMVDHLKGGK